MYPRKESYRPLKSLAQLYKVSVLVPVKAKSPLTLAEDVNISPSPIRGRARSVPSKNKEHRKKKKKKKRSKKASKGKRKKSKKKKKRTSVKPSKRKHRQRAISESVEHPVNAPVARAIRTNEARAKRRSSKSLPRFSDSPLYDADEMIRKYNARSPPLPNARSPPLPKHRPVIKTSSSRSFKNYAYGPLSLSPRKSSVSTLSALPALPTPKRKDGDPVFKFASSPTPMNDSLMQFHSFISELSVVDSSLGITFDDMSHLIQDYQSFADKEFRVDPDGIKRLKDIVHKVDGGGSNRLSVEERSQLNLLKSQSIERLDKAMLLAHRYSMPQWLENDDDTAESSEFISNRRPDYIHDMDSEDTTTE